MPTEEEGVGQGLRNTSTRTYNCPSTFEILYYDTKRAGSIT